MLYCVNSKSYESLKHTDVRSVEGSVEQMRL